MQYQQNTIGDWDANSVVYSMIYIIDLSLQCILVLLVRCQNYLLCLILLGSFSPLLSNLTLGTFCKQNIWRPDLSDIILVNSMVDLFPSNICDTDILCQQMDK